LFLGIFFAIHLYSKKVISKFNLFFRQPFFIHRFNFDENFTSKNAVGFFHETTISSHFFEHNHIFFVFRFELSIFAGILLFNGQLKLSNN